MTHAHRNNRTAGLLALVVVGAGAASAAWSLNRTRHRLQQQAQIERVRRLEQRARVRRGFTDEGKWAVGAAPRKAVYSRLS